MRKYRKTFLLLILAAFIALIFPYSLYSWGFYGHKKINRMAVLILPPEMVGFYKKHIEYITEHAVDPDKRAIADASEAIHHYIDIDHYGAHPFDSLPKKWNDAVAKYTEDTLNKYGINPWWIEKMYFKLIAAFKSLDVDRILNVSANLGHYIGDGCVPLHTTQFYDGKTPDMKGIHAFWESRIPELFGDNYDFFVGQAEYIENPNEQIWKLTKTGNAAIDTIFIAQTKMFAEYPSDKIYTYEIKGQSTVKVFSKDYSQQFSALLNGMIERRLRLAVKMTASFWYTAWVNAGQPDLTKIESKEVSDSLKLINKETDKMWETGKPTGPPNRE